MQCNIDAKGKAVRLTSGLVVSSVAIVLLLLASTGVLGGRWAWIVGLVMLALGAFQIFEGWSGWCVVRALGFKTRV